MANDFAVGIFVGVLIAAFSAHSISRVLDSLPEHDEASRKLADLLFLRDLAKALFGTAGVGRDLLLVAILVSKLFFGWVIMLIANATISPTLSRSFADSLRGNRERKQVQLSPLLPPLVVACILIGAIATLVLKPVGTVKIASSGWALFAPSAPHARRQLEAELDFGDEAAVVEYISGLANSTMSSLASALQQLQEPNPALDGAAAAPLPRVVWQVVAGFVVSALAYGVAVTQESGVFVDDDAGRAASDWRARFGCHLARGASWLLMALCSFPFLRLWSVMWQLHIERGAPGPELQQDAAKSLDMVVDHTFWHCLAHTAVVALAAPTAFVEGLTQAASAAFPARRSARVTGSMTLEHYAGAALLMPVRAAVAVALAACWLLAVAPPTYVFWHAVALRLGSSRSENWVQLLQLGVTVAVRLVLKTAQDGLPARLGQTWVFARAHIIAETAVVATAAVPVFTAVPAISAALVQSKLAERGPTNPSWAALLLLLPTFLAMAARGKEISDDLCAEPTSPLLASHPWLRCVLHHCGWDGGFEVRRRRLGLRLLGPAGPGAAATVQRQPSRLIRLVEAVKETLPKALHLHAAELLELAYEVGLGSFNWKDYPQRDVEAPLFSALRSALGPLGLHASRLLRHAALTEQGREQLKHGLEELQRELRDIHGVLLAKEEHAALQQQLDVVLKYLEAPGLIGLKGTLRLPVPPDAAVRVELVVSHEKTKQRIEQEHLDKLVAAVERVARAALAPEGRTIKARAVRCTSSMRTVHHGERAKLVALLATSCDMDGMTDSFFSDDERSKIVEALKADGSPLRDAAAAEKELELNVHGEPKITDEKRGPIRLADGKGLYEVPIPLETVAKTLEKCGEDCPDFPVSKYGSAEDYETDNLEIDIGGCIPGSTFRVCVNLPVLGCSILYFENFAIDVRLTSGTNTDQLVTLALREWIGHREEEARRRDKESAEKGASGRLCELLVELTIDHPEVLVGDGKTTLFGMVTESDGGFSFSMDIPIQALSTTEEVRKPFKLAGGRYQATIVLALEGGEDFRADGSEVPPHVKDKGPGLFWGFDKDRTAFVEDATFKGLDGPSLKTVEKAVGANKATGVFNWFVPTKGIVKVLLALLTNKNQARAVGLLVDFIVTNILKMQPIIRREQLEMNNGSLFTFVKDAKDWQEKKRREEAEQRSAALPAVIQRERSWKWLTRATRAIPAVTRGDSPVPNAANIPAPAEPAPPPEPVKKEQEWWQRLPYDLPWNQKKPEPKPKAE